MATSISPIAHSPVQNRRRRDPSPPFTPKRYSCRPGQCTGHSAPARGVHPSRTQAPTHGGEGRARPNQARWGPCTYRTQGARAGLLAPDPPTRLRLPPTAGVAGPSNPNPNPKPGRALVSVARTHRRRRRQRHAPQPPVEVADVAGTARQRHTRFLVAPELNISSSRSSSSTRTRRGQSASVAGGGSSAAELALEATTPATAAATSATLA